ncbi:MAG: rod shape-determining protein MreD [Deltaproteobacteria bacterium]|nr:rod shape-determining protein MreD [Deltaproteobacteria bacterium]
MKDFLIMLPMTVVYLSFKSVLAPAIPFPDITLLITIFIAYERPSVRGVALSFALGYIEDVFNGGIIGTSSFALVGIFTAVHMLSRRIHFSTASIEALSAAGLGLVKGFLVWFVLRLSDLNVPVIPQMLLGAFVTGLFAPVILSFFMWFSGHRVPGMAKGGER